MGGDPESALSGHNQTESSLLNSPTREATSAVFQKSLGHHLKLVEQRRREKITNPVLTTPTNNTRTAQKPVTPVSKSSRSSSMSGYSAAMVTPPSSTSLCSVKRPRPDMGPVLDLDLALPKKQKYLGKEEQRHVVPKEPPNHSIKNESQPFGSTPENKVMATGNTFCSSHSVPGVCTPQLEMDRLLASALRSLESGARRLEYPDPPLRVQRTMALQKAKDQWTDIAKVFTNGEAKKLKKSSITPLVDAGLVQSKLTVLAPVHLDHSLLYGKLF